MKAEEHLISQGAGFTGTKQWFGNIAGPWVGLRSGFLVDCCRGYFSGQRGDQELKVGWLQSPNHFLGNLYVCFQFSVKLQGGKGTNTRIFVLEQPVEIRTMTCSVLDRVS